MNIVFIKNVYVGFIVYQIPRVSVFGYFPLYIYIIIIRGIQNNGIIVESLFSYTFIYYIIVLYIVFLRIGNTHI